MSRKLAAAATGLVRAMTSPQTPKRRAMTWSRVIAGLESCGAHTVQTGRGPLDFLALRGPHVAGAAYEFETSEPEMLAWLGGMKAGETLWDVGAAIGVYSMYAALGGMKVLAFEPKATSLGVLVEHLAMNRLGGSVTALGIAFGDRTEIMALQLATIAPAAGGNTLSCDPDERTAPTVFEQGVCAYSIDRFREVFGLAAPDHLKIDVDGVEGLILRGAEKTLPLIGTVMVEVEGANAVHAAERIDPPLLAAGFIEDMAVRETGSRRNRLFRRA